MIAKNTNVEGEEMAQAKVAITLSREFLREIDRWVAEGRYPSRSRAIQEAIRRAPQP